MPNICATRLRVAGPEPAVTAFINDLGGDTPDLTRLHPEPAVFDGVTSIPDTLILHHYQIAEYVDGNMTHDDFLEASRENAANHRVGTTAEATTGFRHAIDWCVYHWGTKWVQTIDVDDVVTTSPAVAVDLTLDSAWSPPLPLIAHISNLHPDLTFAAYYSEWGNGFCGWMCLNNGSVLVAEERTLDSLEAVFDEDSDDDPFAEAFDEGWAAVNMVADDFHAERDVSAL